MFDGVDNDALMIDDCNGECLLSAYWEGLPYRRSAHKPWPFAIFVLRSPPWRQAQLSLSTRVSLRSNCDAPIQLAAPLAW